MGFKDLPGAKPTNQNQASSDKATSQQSPANNALSKQEAVTSSKVSQ